MRIVLLIVGGKFRVLVDDQVFPEKEVIIEDDAVTVIFEKGSIAIDRLAASELLKKRYSK